MDAGKDAAGVVPGLWGAGGGGTSGGRLKQAGIIEGENQQ